MGTKDRIEKAKEELTHIPTPNASVSGAIPSLIRIATQLIMICGNQQIEIDGLRIELDNFRKTKNI